MSDQYPPPPADGVPPNTGQVPPNYATPVPPQYGTSAQPPYGSPAQPPYGSTQQPYTSAAPLDDAQTRQWAGLAHLGGILGFLPSLVIWLVFRERSAFVDQEAKKALNFQISVLIGYVGSAVLGALPFIGGLSGLVTLAIWVTSLVFSIQGYQAVQRGQAYRYPFTLDLIK
ncbi:DUF4870 domain-containing protein [Pengzhenrongella frigida]|uniref:DUF4870 domain-containing protein n=1 Tax=Pengzhenrongella frigida TaxID=1259133 RepID=A0A4Q5N324_9MICO|nr:DUF4870 domain-containing protein [Cellulomonas sp. HLT2-17]RYV52560.1 DUF4870 domain-containing protein [Cellulomonas sp. HLT2-17]